MRLASQRTDVVTWQAVAELGRRAFAVTRRVPGLPAVDGRSASAPALRTSWGFWNTESEVEQIAGLLEYFSANTPETLPARPSIEIVHRGGDEPRP